MKNVFVIFSIILAAAITCFFEFEYFLQAANGSGLLFLAPSETTKVILLMLAGGTLTLVLVLFLTFLYLVQQRLHHSPPFRLRDVLLTFMIVDLILNATLVFASQHGLSGNIFVSLVFLAIEVMLIFGLFMRKANAYVIAIFFCLLSFLPVFDPTIWRGNWYSYAFTSMLHMTALNLGIILFALLARAQPKTVY